MSLEERNTKLIQLLTERKELVQESKRIQEDLGFCFTSRTFSKFDKQDKSSGNTNESLTTTFASLSEEMKILAERLTYCSEEMENLSKGLDSKSIEMFYEEESKKEDALYKFALLKEATTDLRLIDHLKACTSIKYNTTPELFLTDLMKKELKDKVPSASERDMEFAVEDYVGRLRLHYMAELEYRYALFLQSCGFIALNVDIRNDESVHEALEIIKNDEFEKENFKELPFYSLRRGIQLLQAYQSYPAYIIEKRSRISDSEKIPVDKWIAYQNLAKYEWEIAKKSIEDDLCQITKLIARARQAGYEINFDGDPLEEVLWSKSFRRPQLAWVKGDVDVDVDPLEEVLKNGAFWRNHLESTMMSMKWPSDKVVLIFYSFPFPLYRSSIVVLGLFVGLNIFPSILIQFRYNLRLDKEY